ncbi:FAD/NAD(P)-binding domain-containing protein [Wolfiporia cocos MD-104 SS10]|uniref:FAD/NAD(P)-binding domain-containing protein n=1 Tax=Wolfiporia cocos (strain MD-104) TaxID=742152 RepID=A0A2H3JDG3_WOLCO|nr:FAD/NAD(P)-binding domain-containing protein [Wolfiporia cocos MD-104 SS10]
MSELQSYAEHWLREFALAASNGDVAALTQTMLPHGWLRDLLVFTWDFHSLEGRAKISAYLADTLAPAHLSGFELDKRERLLPERAPDGTIGAGFSFDMPARRGRGYVRLLDDEGGEWRAISVLMMVDDIKGHEERGAELGTYEGHTVSWEEVLQDRRSNIERDPYVVIMGAGQNGLMMAARFKQMNLQALVIEKKRRVGDQWRERYPTLSLHSIKNHHTMLYQPYPETWPEFTPRDKMADWLEQYSISQDLVVWTDSYAKPGATYDPSTKRWSLVVSKDGTDVILHPAHIVSAIGSTGPPRIPSLPGKEVFRGITMHSSEYRGGAEFAGKRAIVVGAGQSGADISQDLAVRGAAAVTMVQRSTTCVISRDTGAGVERKIYLDGVPADICDIRFNAAPLGLRKKEGREQEALHWEKEAALHAKLKSSGLKLNMGKDGSGHVFLIYERLGGYWWDVGLADLIESGQVKVKSGVEIKNLTESGVVFTDGSELPADLVVFATGWHEPRTTLREICGAEVIDRTSEAWGMDEEGEIKGICRPTGHPGLWYAVGDFATARFHSKLLALQLKAIQIGMLSPA